MSQDNARLAMQEVKRDFPEYMWEMESGFNSGEFMLHGHDKDGTAENVPVLPRKATSDPLPQQIAELKAEAARLVAESEKTKRAAEHLAERIKHLEKTAL